MTDTEWTIELVDILAGTPWRIATVGVNLEGAMCFARVHHPDGEERSVLLSCDRFTTVAERAGETRRQLGL